MMNTEEEQKIIKYLIEKVTKGVRKQIKGYVKNITNQVDRRASYVGLIKDDFELLYEKSKNLRADFTALELMINEGRQNKKLMCDIHEVINDVNNRMIDLELLRCELTNIVKINKLKE